MNVYDKGDMVRISTATVFADANGTAFDPDEVTIKYTDPGGTTTTKTYPDDSEVVKDDTGDYHLDIDTDVSNAVGVWKYEIKGKTSGSASRGMDDGRFKVRPPQI